MGGQSGHKTRLQAVSGQARSGVSFVFSMGGGFYVDTRLPFGSRSSPAIFNSCADLLAWVLINVAGIYFLLHYLDDYFFANRDFGSCKRDMLTFQSMCNFWGSHWLWRNLKVR